MKAVFQLFILTMLFIGCLSCVTNVAADIASHCVYLSNHPAPRALDTGYDVTLKELKQTHYAVLPFVRPKDAPVDVRMVSSHVEMDIFLFLRGMGPLCFHSREEGGDQFGDGITLLFTHIGSEHIMTPGSLWKGSIGELKVQARLFDMDGKQVKYHWVRTSEDESCHTYPPGEDCLPRMVMKVDRPTFRPWIAGNIELK